MILISGAAGASESVVIREFAGGDILCGRSSGSTIKEKDAMSYEKIFEYDIET